MAHVPAGRRLSVLLIAGAIGGVGRRLGESAGRLTPAQRRLLMAWALLAGPVIGLIASGYNRLIGWVSYRQARGRVQIIAPLLAFGLLGLAAFAYPQLLGNGKDMAHDAFLGSAGLWLLLALFALKPPMAALCLGSGAGGGLFTPTLSTGAALGGATVTATVVARYVDGYSIYSARLHAEPAPEPAASRPA